MLVAFVLIGVIIASFVTRMNREIADQEKTIAKLKYTEDERRRLLALATLAGGAAHELATPIGTLSLIGDDLAQVLGKDPQFTEDIETMRNELARCGAILKRMRGTNSELPGELPQRFSVAAVLREVEQEFASVDGPRVVVKQSPAAEVEIYCLKDALRSALQALVRNAVQACTEGGSVVCRAAEADGRIRFDIEDSGVGMSDDIKARIGEPFFTSKAPGEGMGLGVYLAKLFALQVGGSVAISSELGKGTLVSLQVPKLMQV
jgi:two-component system sensor histidine kinase RegB